MKLITQPRAEDILSSFGRLVRFAALVYLDENEGEGNAFQPATMDGDVVFVEDEDEGIRVFDAMIGKLHAAEGQFLEEMEEEGMVGLFETPNGFMVIAGSTMMGYSGLEDIRPDAHQGMPHISWERIEYDVLKIRRD